MLSTRLRIQRAVTRAMGKRTRSADNKTLPWTRSLSDRRAVLDSNEEARGVFILRCELEFAVKNLRLWLSIRQPALPSDIAFSILVTFVPHESGQEKVPRVLSGPVLIQSRRVFGAGA